MTALSASSVDGFSAVSRPEYDRGRVTTGIVHFGFGNFHRAHQAMYIDRLLASGDGFEWGICGVGVLPSDARMHEVMRAQSGLYTLVVKHPDGALEPRIIGSVTDYLFAPDDPEAVLRALVAPGTRIVSLTITEGGYNTDRVTGEFDLRNPQVAADLRPGAVPLTVFGLVVEGANRRRKAGLAPFTVVSCDNIQGNGDVARDSFAAFARAKDPALGQWFADTVAFPNSMVDRITPVTSDEERALVTERFGIEDAWPVVCEPFVQWVLEDRFTAGRPALENVGVQLVDDVQPYEAMKLRLLNASHQALAYFGMLLGHRYAHEAATDPLLRDLVDRYMREEAAPTLGPVPGVDLDAYMDTLLERFANPEIRDTLARLGTDASDRIPTFLLPVVRDSLAAGGKVALSAGIVASWARFAEGTDESGRPFDVADPLRESLAERARGQRTDPLAFLRNPEIFGSLAEDARFSDEFQRTLADLHEHGAARAIESLLRRA
ncbi:mannitol dehydrogenase family protein [Microbacteriaceae bacterium 4G12]